MNVEWLRELIRKTPSWAFSISFHIMVLACLTLIAFQGAKPTEAAVEVIVVVKSPRREKVDFSKVDDVKRGMFDRKGIESDTPDALEVRDPPVPIPDAIIGDHVETANDMDGNTARGDSMDFTGWQPGTGRGRDGTMPDGPDGKLSRIGVGGGNGSRGKFGDPKGGGRVNMTTLPGGATPATESCVTAGLRWLARHQGKDGGWRSDPFGECAPGTACAGAGYAQYDVGLTGLSLLAFLGAGYTHLSREGYTDPYTQRRLSFGQVVRRATEYLRAQQDEDGCFGPRTGEFMYNHALATLAMVEAFGLTNAVQLREPAQRAIDFLARSQNPYRGWRYTMKPGDNDTSVTGWCVMALKSADISGLRVPRTSYDGARSWIESATDAETGEVGYTGKGKVDVVVRGKNEAWSGHPAMTAVGLLCKIFIDPAAKDGVLDRHAARLAKDLPRWDAGGRDGRPIDFYYWYYGALALFQYDGPDGRAWSAWNKAMQAALVPHQAVRRDGCADGSWDPALDRWGFAGGRVYATAINVLTLEVYYRYGKVRQG